jgi:glycosyltransferase involved in cell wall biosynthesis
MAGVRIALIGTRGVPARYGGFETAVEEVGSRLAARGHSVVVYCRNDGQTADRHLGMQLVNLPALRLKQAETLSHTALSVAHVAKEGCDAAIVFNAANAPFLPALRARGIPFAVHVDGLEWKRAKWSGAGSRYYQWAERTAVRWSDRLIADAQAIRAYYLDRYGAEATFIPYGAPIRHGAGSDRLATVGLESGGYHLVVARMEPENHVRLIVEGYARTKARLPLVVVGSAPHGAGYIASVESRAADSDTRFLGSVWDQCLLDQLYANARLYLHGHSVGGTNPSLLRAMGAGAPVAAYDVVFNREVLGRDGVYFATPEDLEPLILQAEAEPEASAARGIAAQYRAAANYNWDRVADRYEQLCLELAGRERVTAASAEARTTQLQ